MVETRRIDASNIHIEGIVQGVGFRPFVYGLALRHHLGGWVLNNSSGVDMRIFGPADAIERFVRDIGTELPPLAVIDRVDVDTVSPADLAAGVADGLHLSFTIRESEDQPQAFVPVSPDVATCDACLNELLDPLDRRHRYPFTNCTNCGPRFTIVRDIPYDRPLTTMAAFEMCPHCRAEYEDPADRRFHAQPNACPVCGPRLTLVASAGQTEPLPFDLSTPLLGDEALLAARRLLNAGHIVAVKGLGGYHLACGAADDAAVRLLRERKGRVDKPFAVMAADVASVRSFARLTRDETALLTSRQRPIVLLEKRDDCWLADSVAPGNDRLGVMLPYTPLHHLLLQRDSTRDGGGTRPPVYVMTSGNLSEEPIVKDDGEALSRLGPLADAFLQHDREIHINCDDSVVRAFRGSAMFIRRARGYAPAPIRLPEELPPVLAAGGELKNTFCLTNGRYAFMSQHIGDMENLETLQAFTRTVDHYTKIFRVAPALLACDMHPRYLSTRWASQYAETHALQLVPVQHHHAHICAVMAEHGLGPGESVIGVALDGTGYGTDGTIWGGELLVAAYASYTRAARLRPVPLPGGDAAIRRPYRIALAYLWDAGIAWHDALPPFHAASEEERRILRRQLETGLNATPTSSMGRFFDAVASLAGVRHAISYEAQAAMEFEAQSAHAEHPPYVLSDVFLDPPAAPLSIREQASPGLHSEHPELQFEIDPRPIVRQVADDVVRNVSPAVVSARFHMSIAAIVHEACRRVRETTGLDRVALSGGVFQNLRLLGLVLDRLEADSFHVLVHRQVPANDGGIALGQALAAHYGSPVDAVN